MNLRLTPGRLLAAAIALLSIWIVHGFVEAVLAAGVTAIASWPLYAAFQARLPRSVGRSAGAVIFTAAITVFVLAPLVFAGLALLGEAHSLFLSIAAADARGFVTPEWLASMPVIGPWLAAHWQSQIVSPGALLGLTQHADPAAVLGLAQSLGQATARHALIVGFTILLLTFLYQGGDSLGSDLIAGLSEALGDRADHYVRVGTRALRASVNSMLVVALFDGIATALAYSFAGAPHALLWAAITGSLAAVPFVGYAAVSAMAVHLMLNGASSTTLLSLPLGCAVLLCGDKLVRPLVARTGMRLPFVWVLMGSIGGFSVLGLAGLVIGPVVLTLAQEVWEQRVREDRALKAAAPKVVSGRVSHRLKDRPSAPHQHGVPRLR